MARDTFDDLQMSYGRCLRNGRFIERFYEIFMASHPQVPALFANTDMGRQSLALRRGISAAISHAGGSTLAQRTMSEMARAHSRSGRAPVPAALYPYWLESLLKAVAEHDPQCNAALLQRWRVAMERTIAYFIEHH
jgi:hemoglobin-like flavoprotein